MIDLSIGNFDMLFVDFVREIMVYIVSEKESYGYILLGI